MYTKSNTLEIEVNGITFEKFSDFNRRGTYALNKSTGEILPLTTSGYCSNLATIKRKIKTMFF